MIKPCVAKSRLLYQGQAPSLTNKTDSMQSILILTKSHALIKLNVVGMVHLHPRRQALCNKASSLKLKPNGISYSPRVVVALIAGQRDMQASPSLGLRLCKIGDSQTTHRWLIQC